MMTRPRDNARAFRKKHVDTKDGPSPLFAGARTSKDVPQLRGIARVRHRQYLVEDWLSMGIHGSARDGVRSRTASTDPQEGQFTVSRSARCVKNENNWA